MYAKLVSLVGPGKVLCYVRKDLFCMPSWLVQVRTSRYVCKLFCMQGLVLYAKMVGTGKDFIFCMPSCGPLNLSDWLLKSPTMCHTN